MKNRHRAIQTKISRPVIKPTMNGIQGIELIPKATAKMPRRNRIVSAASFILFIDLFLF